MTETKIFIVEENAAQRLDVFLAQELEFSRSRIKNFVDEGNVTVNDLIEKCGKILKKGDAVKIHISEAEILDLKGENIPLDILYEDDDIAVINKQQGLSVHPSGSIVSGTLVNALLYHLKSLSGINGIIRPGIVHRLDKDTSGVMVIAKNDAAHLKLSEDIALRRNFIKIYYALLEGVIKEESGTVNAKIERSKNDRKLMTVSSCGRDAITNYQVKERFKENCLVEFNILTGRTHQIRVHAKYISHPVVGDKSYGYKKQRFNLNGQLLHSYSLTFSHPVKNQLMTFTAPLPDYFEKVLSILRKESKE